MDRQRDPYSGRFGESASASRRPTGSYRSQPSGSYKSRPDYEPNSRPGSRSAPGDSYTRRPVPRTAPSNKASDRARRRRRRKLRILALILLLVLIAAGIVVAVCAKRNQVVHQMPTVQRVAESENVTITEET